MIVDKYTKHSIFSLPLIFDNIFNKEDLKNNGFVNMYIYDINNSLLSNHFFLAFTYLSNTLLDKLKEFPNYYTNYIVIINNIKYSIVCFTRGFYADFIIKNTEKGLYYENAYESKVRILEFWNPNNRISKSLLSYLFNPNAHRLKPVSENITIQDNKKAVD